MAELKRQRHERGTRLTPFRKVVAALAAATLTGLLPNTLYHYRVVAENSADEAVGADRTFTTARAAPLAVTEAATDVTAAGATLHGTVNARNDETEVWFAYGPRGGATTTAAAAPATATGLDDTAVTLTLTDLAPETEYLFRVVAESDGGTAHGEDRTFTTLLPPPTVTTLAPSQVSPLGAEIHATVNARGQEAAVAFEYGESTAYGLSAAGTPSPVTGREDVRVTAVLWNLTPGATYHYRAVAAYADGAVYGEDRTFTTPEIPPDPGHTVLLPLVRR